MLFFRFSLHFHKLCGIIEYHEHKGELKWRRDFIGKWNLTADTHEYYISESESKSTPNWGKFMCVKVVSIRLTTKSSA